MKSPFEPETYEVFAKRLINSYKAKQILLDIKHKQMDAEGKYVPHHTREAKAPDISERAWQNQERTKNQRRYAIQRALDEIDYMINKRCHMSRNIPSNIRCSVKLAKTHIIALWMKELEE